MTARTARHALAIVLLLAGGCAMFVSKDEYRDYRAVQLASGERSRLLALQRYAAAHGDGRWIEESGGASGELHITGPQQAVRPHTRTPR